MWGKFGLILRFRVDVVYDIVRLFLKRYKIIFSYLEIIIIFNLEFFEYKWERL